MLTSGLPLCLQIFMNREMSAHKNMPEHEQKEMEKVGQAGGHVKGGRLPACAAITERTRAAPTSVVLSP